MSFQIRLHEGSRRLLLDGRIARLILWLALWEAYLTRTHSTTTSHVSVEFYHVYDAKSDSGTLQRNSVVQKHVGICATVLSDRQIPELLCIMPQLDVEMASRAQTHPLAC